MPNKQVNITELNRRESHDGSLTSSQAMRDLEVFGDELRIAEETVGNLFGRIKILLRSGYVCVGVSDQNVEDFIAWRRTISSLIADDFHAMKIS